ncbi:MAG: hypothetical protein HFP76_10565 [Methylococcales symbiont of Iophon sp. n. MRB-2018]|nr:MAG: hypothetical protein HFP76_10565 [Methylococcales symbiont of Iophon sp. n. MRB-2018]
MAGKSNKNKRETRRTKQTILFVGEGKTEVAFIKHLKSLYQPERSPPVRVDTQDGGDAGKILPTALKRPNTEARDAIVCLYDLDKDLPVEYLKKAKDKKFVLIGAKPCIEGFMLDILEKKRPHSTKNCKHKMHPMLGGKGKETDLNSYKIFTKEILEKSRRLLPNLDLILSLIETGKR